MMFQPQASTVASRVDTLFYALLGLSAIVVIGVFIVIVWFSIKYRHGSCADRSGGGVKTLGIELTWTLVPFGLFIGIFAWSISLFADMKRAPQNATPVYIVAKQWMWKVEHEGGQREINTLHVPLHQATRLVMTSQDVIHSFYVPAFRLKQDVLPGRFTQLWFEPTRTGTFSLFCAEYCGTDHSRMMGSIVVMDPANYSRWLSDHVGPGLSERGALLFRRLGCSGCHDSHSGVHAPSLEGLYGRTVPLQDGTSVRVDDRYIQDSILLPAKQVAAGYDPVMPSYSGRIGEEDVLALIAYLKVIGGASHEQH